MCVCMCVCFICVSTHLEILVVGGDSEGQGGKTAAYQLVLKAFKYSVHLISPQTTITTIISYCRHPPPLIPSLRMHMVLFLTHLFIIEQLPGVRH